MGGKEAEGMGAGEQRRMILNYGLLTKNKKGC
jgi:hypothetical protein